MSIIQELITDRTQADVDRVKYLKRKYMSGESWTDSERNEYFYNVKGAYNFSDMNRVGEATQYIKSLYDSIGEPIDVSPKTDWKVEDIPTQEQMETYLGNIQTIKKASGSKLELPLTMTKLNYEGANQIERVLIEANDIAIDKTRDFIYSGEFSANEALW